MEYIANAENKFTDLIHLETGCIKIGISTTLIKEFLLLYLEKFHSLYPKINIQIITNFTSDLISKLKNGFVDIVILNLNDKYKELLHKEISMEVLNRYPLILQAKDLIQENF